MYRDSPRKVMGIDLPSKPRKFFLVADTRLDDDRDERRRRSYRQQSKSSPNLKIALDSAKWFRKLRMAFAGRPSSGDRRRQAASSPVLDYLPSKFRSRSFDRQLLYSFSANLGLPIS